MLSHLDSLYQRYGVFQSSLLRLQDDMPGVGSYINHFGSWDEAFQHLYRKERDCARRTVQDLISQQVAEVLSYSDFLVLNRKLALSIQPAVPVPHGYTQYWPVRPDSRSVIDITLGVLLSEPNGFEILGYLAVPRLLGGTNLLRVSPTSPRIELFGRNDLTFLRNLV